MWGENKFRGIDGISEQFNPETTIEKLKPEVIETEEGIKHTVYTFGTDTPIRVMFCNPEELPFSQELAKKYRVFMFGDQPKHRSRGDWESFVAKMRTGANPNDQAINPGVLDTSAGDTLFVVQPNPRAILDMALTLGVPEVDRAEIMEACRMAAKRQATEKSDDMVDAIIAAKLVGLDNELQPPTAHITDAEALVLLALTGNAEVQIYFKNKVARLKQLDTARLARKTEERRVDWEQHLSERGKKVDPLKIKELVGVHMTRYLPADRDQAWGVSTTFDATNGLIPRATQHFTLNHAVRSAGLYGNWEDMPVCLMMPLQDMITNNGNPANLNTVDTFWEVSPGHQLQFPQDKARLIKPGLIREPGVLSVASGHEIIYKTSHVSSEDVRELCDEKSEQAIKDMSASLLKNMFASLKERRSHPDGQYTYEFIIQSEELRNMLITCGVHEDDFQFDSFPVYKANRNIVAEFSVQPLEVVVDNLLNEAKLENTAIATVRPLWYKAIEDYFTSIIKYQVINKQIQDMGYTVHDGGMWAWDGDSYVATDQTRALGVDLEIQVGPHSAHVSYAIEEMVGKQMDFLEKGRISPKEYCERSVGRSIADVSPAVRRLLYQLGLV